VNDSQTKQNYFLSQPHQPFFTLGVLNAIVAMLIFALAHKGVLSLNVENLNFHVYSLIFLVFTNVFTGFLFTTYPRFCQAQVVSKKYYSNLFYLSSLGSLLFLTGAFVSHLLLLSGTFILFASQSLIVFKLREIYKQGSATDKQDAFWILVAQFFGLLGSALFLSIALNEYVQIDVNLLGLAINASFYLYVIFLGFSVAQRMIPFFSHSFAMKNPNFVKIIFVLFVLKSLFSALDFKWAEIAVDLLLGVYTLLEFRRWELPLFRSPAILWVLHLALFWLPTAFFLSAITLSLEEILEISFYFLNVHLLALGFLTTLLIGFGTRVTLGHSGQAPHADKFYSSLFLLIQVIVLSRALFSVNVAFEWGLDFIFDVSFALWLVLFLVWSVRYAKTLTFGSKV